MYIQPTNGVLLQGVTELFLFLLAVTPPLDTDVRIQNPPTTDPLVSTKKSRGSVVGGF